MVVLIRVRLLTIASKLYQLTWAASLFLNSGGPAWSHAPIHPPMAYHPFIQSVIYSAGSVPHDFLQLHRTPPFSSILAQLGMQAADQEVLLDDFLLHLHELIDLPISRAPSPAEELSLWREQEQRHSTREFWRVHDEPHFWDVVQLRYP